MPLSRSAKTETRNKAELSASHHVRSGHRANFLPLQAPAYAPPEHQAELFYLQKQIQSATPMVVVLEDGEEIEGVIEWYDRYSMKIRGRSRVLVYKSSIKYMYKKGDPGQ